MAAAQAGLFSDLLFRCYPKGFPYTRITLTHLSNSNARMRYISVQETDLLDSIHQGCTVEKKDILFAKAFSLWPDCQLAMELNNNIVIAVICERTEENNKHVVVQHIHLHEQIDKKFYTIFCNFIINYFFLKDDVSKLMIKQGNKIGFTSNDFVEVL